MHNTFITLGPGLLFMKMLTISIIIFLYSYSCNFCSCVRLLLVHCSDKDDVLYYALHIKGVTMCLQESAKTR